MKKFFIISMLAVYLISNTEFGQISKLPILIQHFFSHKQQDQSISFMEYLNIHYFGKDLADSDYETDQKLPFKTTLQNSFSSVFFSNPTNYYSLVSFKEFTITNYLITQVTFIKSAYLSFIWQPPKY